MVQVHAYTIVEASAMLEQEARNDHEEDFERLAERMQPIDIAGDDEEFDNVSEISSSYSTRPNTAASSAVPLVMDTFIPMMSMTSFFNEDVTKDAITPLCSPSVTLPSLKGEQYISCLAENKPENNIEVEVFKMANEEEQRVKSLTKSPTCENRQKDGFFSTMLMSRKKSVHPNAPISEEVPKSKRKLPMKTSCDIDLHTGRNSSTVDLVKTHSAHPRAPSNNAVTSDGKAVRIPLEKSTSLPTERNKLEPIPLGSKVRSAHPKTVASDGKTTRIPLEKTTSAPTERNKLEPIPLGTKVRSAHPKVVASEDKAARILLKKTTSTVLHKNNLAPKPMAKSCTNADGVSLTVSFDGPVASKGNEDRKVERKPPLYPRKNCAAHLEEGTASECLYGNIEVVLRETFTDDTMATDDNGYETEEEFNIEPEGLVEEEPKIASPPTHTNHKGKNHGSKVEPEEQVEDEPKAVISSTNLKNERELILQPQVEREQESATERYTRGAKMNDNARKTVDLNEYLFTAPSQHSVESNNGSIKTETTQKMSNTSGIFVPVPKKREDVVYFPIRQPKRKKKKKNKVTMSSGLGRSAEKKSVRTEKAKKNKETVVRYAVIKRPKKKKENGIKMW